MVAMAGREKGRLKRRPAITPTQAFFFVVRRRGEDGEMW